MTVRYVKLLVQHDDYPAALATCRAAFLAAHPGNRLSVVDSPSGAACWVKTTQAADLALGGAVLDMQDGSNSRAGADLVVWYPPPAFPEGDA